MRLSRNLTLIPAASLLLVALLAGCGSSSNNSSNNSSNSSAAGPSSTPAVCSDLTALEASVKKLQNVTLAKGVGAEVQGDFAQIEEDLTTLSNDAQAQYRLQVGQLTDALDALSAAAKTLRSDPTSKNLSGVRTAIRDVSTNFQSLVSALSSTC